MMKMFEKFSYVNLSLYVLVLAYILFINLNVDNNMTFLRNLMTNPLFKVIVLSVIAVAAFEMFDCLDFTLAILLTIAFLNTTMILNRNSVNEGFTSVYNRLRENFEDNKEEDPDKMVMKMNEEQEEEDKEQSKAELKSEEEDEEEKEEEKKEDNEEDKEDEEDEEKENFLDFNGNKAGSCSPGLDSQSVFNPQPANDNTFGAPY